ncbi:MAG: methyltransferase domain-containing protein [Gemmataceae bacterium]
MSLQPEPFSRRGAGLASKAFFYARTPMLLIDPAGIVIDTNAACRVLLGLDLAGCNGQLYTYLLDRLGSRTSGALLPLDGVTSTHFASPRDDLSARRVPQLDTADLRAAVSECLYHSAAFGPVRLRVSEVPSIDTESGTCSGSIVSLEVADLPALAAFQGGVDRRLGHEVMWEVYAASYDRTLSEMPFYQEVVERHYAAMNKSEVNTVLDIGAGTGTVTTRLLGAGKRVTAVDVNRAMLEKLNIKINEEWRDRLTIIEDTAEWLPHLGDEIFDGVTVLLSFFDMENPIAALGEAQRVLKPGGTLVITEPRACFNVAKLMAAAEDALRARSLLDRLAGDWKRIQTVAPLVRDAVQEVQTRKAAADTKQDWHAEALFDALQRNGFINLTFQESHLGNCATISGFKPSSRATLRYFGTALGEAST